MSGTAMGQIPEAALAAADHVLGGAHAKLTLLEYGDYECPACIQAEPLMQHLVDTHRGRLRLVFRHFPLVEVHPNAELAAEAAEAAAAQGQFWPMHHLLFAQTHHLTPAALVGYAQSLGLDTTPSWPITSTRNGFRNTAARVSTAVCGPPRHSF